MKWRNVFLSNIVTKAQAERSFNGRDSMIEKTGTLMMKELIKAIREMDSPKELHITIKFTEKESA